MRTLGSLAAIAVGTLLTTYALPTQAEAIKIGISQPISGTNGDYFKRQFVNPAILAIEEFNAKGGLFGQKIDYVIEDNRANAGTAQAVARKLVDVDRVSMISISISPAVLATLPISDPKQVIVMTVSQHPKILTSEWTALSTPTAAGFGVAAAKYAIGDLHAKTASLLLENNDAIRISGKTFKDEFERTGGKVVETTYFDTENQDFRAQLTKIRAANPDLLNIQAVGARAYGLALKQAAELNFSPTYVIGGDQIIDPQVKEIAGTLHSKVFYTTTKIDPQWNEKQFKPRFGYDGDGFAARVYDGTKIYLTAVQRAGTSDPVKVRDTLFHIKDFHGALGTWGYDGSGEPHIPVYVEPIP
jgi:branched-chain amino acid transport system substrate-binding protein